MKERLKRFWREYWKPVAGVSAIAVLAFGMLIAFNLESRKSLVQTSSKTESNGLTSEEVKPTEVSGAEEVKESAKESSENSEENTSVTAMPTMEAKKSETGKISVTKEAEPAAIVTPTTESKYIPITEGWKAEVSAKGDITSGQKADLDSVIQTWKSGALTDTELKDKIISYLDGQKIDYMEVSVTSKGYALFYEVPKIDLRDGGNLYSFVGTYSTGKQNPDGTNKTVCYNWSAFIF